MHVHDNDPGRAVAGHTADCTPGTTHPLSIEPSASALLALVQRLADTDLDAALELSRLLAAAHQCGALAEQAIHRGRPTVALAWLRMITREVDTLQVQWLRSQEAAVHRLQRERRSNGPVVAHDPFVATLSGTIQTGDTPETVEPHADVTVTLHAPHHAHS